MRLPTTKSILLHTSCMIVTACAAPPAQPSPSPTVRPPTSAARLPFDGKKLLYIGEKNDPALVPRGVDPFHGFDNSLADYIAKSLGVATQPIEVTASTREQALQQDRAQLVIATYSVTQPRATQVDFAGIYLMSDQGVVVRKEDARGISSSADLPHDAKKICTTTGSVQSRDQQLPSHSATYAQQCLGQVKDGTSFAVYSDLILLYHLARDEPSLAVVPVPDLGQRAYYGVGIKKGSPDCGRVAELVKQYLANQWTADFETYFQDIAIADPNFDIDYKPSPDLIRKFTNCTAASAG